MQYQKMPHIYKRIRVLRDAGEVTRSHTCRRINNRSVAEHSYGMAVILMQLADAHAQRTGEPYRAESITNMLQAALVHDLSEVETGDVPAPTKWKYPALKTELNRISTEWEQQMRLRYPLTTEEQELVSWVDMVEFALTAIEEVSMGNSFFKEYLANAIRNLDERPVPRVYSWECRDLCLSLTLHANQLLHSTKG